MVTELHQVCEFGEIKHERELARYARVLFFVFFYRHAFTGVILYSSTDTFSQVLSYILLQTRLHSVKDVAVLSSIIPR